MIDSILRDIRVALRGFRRTPTFAVAVLAILGLGIGTSVAMFITLQTVVMRRLPVQDQDRIVVMWTHTPTAPEMAPPATVIPEARSASHTLRGVAGVVHFGASPRPFVDGDRSRVISYSQVTSNFFDVLGAKPVIGRFLRSEDDEVGAPPSMVISYVTWQSQFSGDSAVLGRVLTDPYGGSTVTIVGVAPAGLDYPLGTGSWLSLRTTSTAQALAVGRLAPGASVTAAREEYLSIVDRLEPAWKLSGANAETFTEAVLGDVRPILNTLGAAVGLLLLIACVNVGTLFLARANARSAELAVRRALGATYGDIARQLIAESAMLALAGGATGVACAAALLRTLVVFAPGNLPRVDDLTLHGSLVGTALAITVLCTLIFGVLPALAAAKGSPYSPMRRDARTGGETLHHRRVRKLLVGAQVAFAVVLLAGAALLSRSLQQLERLQLGYEADHLSILSVAFDAKKYWPDNMTGWADDAMQRIRAIGGVTAVTPVMMPPFYGPNFWHPPFEIEGQPADSAHPFPSIPVEAAGEDYFHTFETPVVRGRGFNSGDQNNAPRVAIVNQSLARSAWPGIDPIGKRLRFHRLPESTVADAGFQWITVIGVVPDTRYRSLRETSPMIYLPWRQFGGWQGSFAVRSSVDIGAVTADIRRAFKAVDPTLVVFDVKSLERFLDGPLAGPRLSALLLSAFGLAALMLATIGLYGVMSSVVREQTREIGIRLALGATPKLVRHAVLRQALMVACAGAVVGLGTTLAASRLLKSLLFEVSPTDPLLLALVCGVLMAAAGAAAYIPARRATKVDPAMALRSD